MICRGLCSYHPLILPPRGSPVIQPGRSWLSLGGHNSRGILSRWSFRVDDSKGMYLYYASYVADLNRGPNLPDLLLVDTFSELALTGCKSVWKKTYCRSLNNYEYYGPIFLEKLCYTMLYYTIPYYTILYYTILYYTILYYTILYYTILYYTILYYTILYYTILYYTILD